MIQPRPVDMNQVARQKSPELRRIRYWYHRINGKLGHALPRIAFIGWMPKHMEGSYLGYSCWLDFGTQGKGVVILISRLTRTAANLWMATLTHEIAHLLNPHEDCGTVKHEDAVIALRRKVLNIRKWRML